ncbi:MAG TPA: YceH family protein [Acidimicrobiales bacterium]
MLLSPECARVLGALMEKGLATPQQYPLTVNALQSACNQTSNREPVVSYDETTVLAALDELKDQKLVRFVLPSHGRSVVRYRQVLDETLALDARQCAVLAVLLLRGPQTIGELRIRTERMATFDSLDEIQHELDLLHTREEPLAHNVGRRPGQKEERWATTLVPAPDPDQPRQPAAAAPTTAAPTTTSSDDMRAELEELRAEVADLRHDVQELRTSLGG